MTDKDKIRELLETSLDGTISTEQVTAAGLHRSVLHVYSLVMDGRDGHPFHPWRSSPLYNGLDRSLGLRKRPNGYWASAPAVVTGRPYPDTCFQF